MKNSATSGLFIGTATTKGMPNTKRSVSVTTDRMLEEPCEATSLTHGFGAERRGRPFRLGNQLAILKQGVQVWNGWRQKHPETPPDLGGADFSDAMLWSANLWGANLSGVTLFRAGLESATFCRADLSEADLTFANLEGADLRGAILTGATLSDANLTEVDLSAADLRRATLRGAQLVRVNLTEANLREANLQGADLSGCSIHGVSVWNAQLEEANQANLVITGVDEPVITVDSLEVAQFIYLILNNTKIRQVIDTITSKVVLILGRFTPERKAVLDTLRDELRERNYLPVLFDFEKPASRDITETISTLAHLARFVIADITNAKSIPQELMTIVPNLPSVPVQPLILESQHEYSMFEHFTRYPWVLPVYRYTDEASLLQSLQENVIAPAEEKARRSAKP